MNIENNTQCQIALSLLPRLNAIFSLPLMDRCGGIRAFFEESEQALAAIYQELEIHTPLPDRAKALEEAKRELEKTDLYGIRTCDATEEGYPPLLRECEDAPLVLYYIGNLQTEQTDKLLAIVGTRRASSRCQERVDRVIDELCQKGHHPVIVSGLAYGIDAAAHRSSLKHGLRTFAVVGHGLHLIYPAAHKQLASDIVQSGGALISEYPCTVAIHPSNFLKRNRIVAGMCQATLVAESAIKGGAMSTARTALSYNREVMAFPGRPEDAYSAGCNQLIKENVAALVENGLDVSRLLGYPEQKPQPQQGELPFFEPEGQASPILSELQKQGEMHIDELARATSIDSASLTALLLQLELEGKIRALPGQKYSLK